MTRTRRWAYIMILSFAAASCTQTTRTQEPVPEVREPFAPTYLDRCWIPLPRGEWKLRSRSFGNWGECMTGPGEPAGPYAKAYFDTDGDGDVDLLDFAELQDNWTIR